VTALVARIAARQHGLVTLAQLLVAGFTRSAISRWVARGSLHRVYRGVYAVGHRGLSREGLWLAAVFAAGTGAALSHLCAAALWDLRPHRTSFVTVVAPKQRRPKGPVRVHECGNLDPRDITTRRGIPVTTAARTLVDLSDVLTAYQLANVIYEAAYRGLFNEKQTREAMERARGRHNLHVLEKALFLHRSGSAGTRSGNEDSFLSMLSFAGMTEPLVNTTLHGVEVDFHWPGVKLAVEIDGPGHARPRAKRDDATKARVLAKAGYQLLRFTDDELDEAVTQVRAALPPGHAPRPARAGRR
jgi:hypothetical protein